METTKTFDLGDIDIDCRNREEILQHIEHVPAKKSDGTKHATGVYVQDVEFDPLNGLCSIDYDSSPFTKFDFLNLKMLQHFNSNQEIIDLMNKEPNWDLLKIPELVKKLPQIHDHFDLVQEVNPKSVEDLMFILFKIRENSKYQFKICHALAYSLNIVTMLNYMEQSNSIPDDM